MQTGIELIYQESVKQKTLWCAEHDQSHRYGELAVVAAALCVSHTDATVSCPASFIEDGEDCWGLVKKHYNDRIKQLQIAGALICAEIDRIRANNKPLGIIGKEVSKDQISDELGVDSEQYE